LPGHRIPASERFHFNKMTSGWKDRGPESKRAERTGPWGNRLKQVPGSCNFPAPESASRARLWLRCFRCLNGPMTVHPWSKVLKHPEGPCALHLDRDRDPEAAQAACRFSAALLPLRLSLTMSKDNFWPSARLRIPARSTAQMLTNTSGW